MNYKKYYFQRVFMYIAVLVLILQGNIALGQSIESNSCSNLLPEDARALINEKYSNWRILSKNDLLYDDQMLWNKNHEKECPGVAIGKYRNDNESDYAVLIIPQKDKTTKKTKLLMLNRETGGGFAIKLLYDDKNITNYPVIYKSDSGQYFYFYDSKKIIVAKHDVVIYEHIEASAIVFYYKEGKYKQLLISD